MIFDEKDWPWALNSLEEQNNLYLYGDPDPYWKREDDNRFEEPINYEPYDPTKPIWTLWHKEYPKEIENRYSVWYHKRFLENSLPEFGNVEYLDANVRVRKESRVEWQKTRDKSMKDHFVFGIVLVILLLLKIPFLLIAVLSAFWLFSLASAIKRYKTEITPETIFRKNCKEAEKYYKYRHYPFKQ